MNRTVLLLAGVLALMICRAAEADRSAAKTTAASDPGAMKRLVAPNGPCRVSEWQCGEFQPVPS